MLCTWSLFHLMDISPLVGWKWNKSGKFPKNSSSCSIGNDLNHIVEWSRWNVLQKVSYVSHTRCDKNLTSDSRKQFLLLFWKNKCPERLYWPQPIVYRTGTQDPPTPVPGTVYFTDMAGYWTARGNFPETWKNRPRDIRTWTCTWHSCGQSVQRQVAQKISKETHRPRTRVDQFPSSFSASLS